MDSPKITVRNFNFYYGATKALKNVNIDIPENKVTGIIGPSGCGKSTFLRSLNRMNDVIAGAKVDGRVVLDGRNIYDREEIKLNNFDYFCIGVDTTK